jgi:hypothetical protein
MRNFSISGRQFNYQNVDNAVNFWQFYLDKFYGGGTIESFFNSMKIRSPLYGGRPCNVEYSFSKLQVDALNAQNIGVMLTLSNHYFTKEAYAQTIPALERIDHPLNSVVMVNDKLARRIARDFPQIKRKASVIKQIKTLDEIHRALELYHSVVLHPMLNDEADFLQSIDCKECVVLFANSRCLYRCAKPICYKYISKQMTIRGQWDKQVCSYQNRRELVDGYTVFDLSHARFAGFTAFKLIPVPDDHFQLDYRQENKKKATLIATSNGIRMIR